MNNQELMRALKGTCITADYTITSMDKEWVQSILPPELTLSSHGLHIEESKHPVLLMYNDTTLEPDLSFEIPAKLHYDEFIISIPFVKFKDSTISEESYIFLSVLYLNDSVAVYGGRKFYYFNKNKTRIQKRNIWTTIYQPNETIPKVELLKYRSLEYQGDTTNLNNNFSKIKSILHLPVLTCDPIDISSSTEERKYMKSKYIIHYEDAPIYPRSVDINNLECAFFPKGEFSFKSIAESFLGSFRFTFKWQLSFPEKIVTVREQSDIVL